MIIKRFAANFDSYNYLELTKVNNSIDIQIFDNEKSIGTILDYETVCALISDLNILKFAIQPCIRDLDDSNIIEDDDDDILG